MAFTADEILSISEILETTPDRVNSQLTYLGTRVTADVETRVRAKITAYGPASGKFAKFKAKESNQGFELDPSDAKRSIRKAIAGWLEFEDLGGGSSFVTYLERG